jgi:uncharacterized protein DUF4333
VLARPAVAGIAAACLLLLLSVVFLAGCGGRTLDTSRLETQIGRTLSERSGLPITSVDCPNDVKAKKGGQFACTVTTSSKERVRVNVTQDDDQGGVTWKLAGPLKR